MITLFFAWLFCLWLSIAFGLGARSVLHAVFPRTEDRTAKHSPDLIALFGFAFLTVLVSYLSLVVPIGLPVQAGVLLAGIALTVRHFSEFRALGARALRRLRSLGWFYRLLAGVVLLTALWEGVNEITLEDTLVYHMPAVRWISEYPVVPGLGNLHGRLAFNSHFFIISALFEIEFAKNLIMYPLNSFLFALLAMRLIVNIDRAAGQKEWFPFLLNTLLLLLAAYFSLRHVESISTDIPNSVLTIYIFLLFLELSRHKEFFRPFLLVTLVLTAITFKLSSIFLAVLLPGFLLSFSRRRLAALAALGALVLFPFFYRNVVLSGYLVYPYPELDLFEVEWKIPEDAVHFEKDLIKTWNRRSWALGLNQMGDFSLTENEYQVIETYSQMTFRDWFIPWWNHRVRAWKPIFIINLLIIIPLIMSLFRREYKITALIATILLGFLFWFFNAPAPRLAAGLLTFGSALTIAYGLQPVLQRFDLRRGYAYVIVGAGVLLLWSYQIRKNRILDGELEAARLFYPHPIVIQPTTPFRGDNFTMQVAPPRTNFCGANDFPCTPYPKKNLALRGDDLGAGFRIAAP